MKRAVLTGILILGAVVSILTYAGLHAAFSARNLDMDDDARLALLEKSHSLFPFNAEGLEQAGRIRLDRAAGNPADFGKAQTDLLAAYRDFQRDLKLNPCSALGHFYYARTLSLMKFIPGYGQEAPFPEYQKAAELAGPNRQLRKEIGLALFNQWERLPVRQRSFTEGLLKQSLTPQDMAGFQEILYLWYLNVRDYGVMDRIMPSSAEFARAYAQFLGDRSMSLEARHKALVTAEDLDFGNATAEYDAAQTLSKYGQLAEAASHLERCRRFLGEIKFFASLEGKQDVGASVEKKNILWKSATLALAQAKLEKDRKLEDAEPALREFLNLDISYSDVTALDAYLKDLRIIPESDSDASLKDIRRLSFEVLLMFRLHKYRQIVSLGSQLQRSVMVPDAATRRDLSEIFTLVGDSYLKLDFVYEPEGFYQRALELAPDDLGILSRMKKYYERRNETDKINEVDRLLGNVLSGGQVLKEPRLLAKGAALEQSLLLGGSQKQIRVAVQLGFLPGNPKPLVSVYLNDRVIWEDYAAQPEIDLQMGTMEGLNKLEVRAVNGPVAVSKLNVEAVAPAEAQASEKQPKVAEKGY